MAMWFNKGENHPNLPTNLNLPNLREKVIAPPVKSRINCDWSHFWKTEFH